MIPASSASVPDPNRSLLGDLQLLFCPLGVAIEPDHRWLLVADLHLEKGSALAARGTLAPPYDTAATLARLTLAIERHRPRLVIALGDSFHDHGGPARMAGHDRAALAALQAGRSWLWIAGNHDRELSEPLPGDHADHWTTDGVTLRHEPTQKPPGPEIAGHLHPCARIRAQGRSLRRKCFVSDTNRLILPAFGAFTGGLNVRDPAIHGLFPTGYRAHMIGTDRVYAVTHRQCYPD